MSVKSQETNMRRLAELLGHDLSSIHSDRESGSNGDKKTFLHLGKVFLRALAKDLGLHNAKILSSNGGIGTSGECSLAGMWESGGVYLCLSQIAGGRNVLLYRSIRSAKDHKGGCNHFLSHRDFASMSYPALLDGLLALRKDTAYERAA